jgi:hypothetical protein
MAIPVEQYRALSRDSISAINSVKQNRLLVVDLTKLSGAEAFYTCHPQYLPFLQVSNTPSRSYH